MGNTATKIPPVKKLLDDAAAAVKSGEMTYSDLLQYLNHDMLSKEDKLYILSQFKPELAAVGIGILSTGMLARTILKYYMYGKSTTVLLQVCADALAVALVKERDRMQLDDIKSKHVDVLDTTLTAIRNTKQSHFSRSLFRKTLRSMASLVVPLNADTAASEMAESAAKLFEEQPKLLKEMAEKSVKLLTKEDMDVTLKDNKGRLLAKLTLSDKGGSTGGSTGSTVSWKTFMTFPKTPKTPKTPKIADKTNPKP